MMKTVGDSASTQESAQVDMAVAWLRSALGEVESKKLHKLDFHQLLSNDPVLASVRQSTQEKLFWADLWKAFCEFFQLSGKELQGHIVQKWYAEWQALKKQDEFVSKTIEAMAAVPVFFLCDPARPVDFTGVTKLSYTPFNQMWLTFLVHDAVETWNDGGLSDHGVYIIAHGDVVALRTNDYLKASWKSVPAEPTVWAN